MDLFAFRDRVVEDYGQFSRSFTEISAQDVRDFVDGKYGAGEYWPSPLIQLNPSFVGGVSSDRHLGVGSVHHYQPGDDVPLAFRETPAPRRSSAGRRPWATTSTSGGACLRGYRR